MGLFDTILGGLLGIGGAAVSSRSASKAADSQAEAARIASEAQKEMYYQGREDTAPWRIKGAAALKDLYGTGSRKGLIEAGPGEFKESPSYQFTLGEGLKGLQRAASATGRLASGDYLKDATKYAEGLASTEYDNFLRRYYESLNPYLSLAGMGQIAAGQSSNAATQTGQGLAQNALYAGQAQAAGNLGASYPWTQVLNRASEYAFGQPGAQNALTMPQYWSQSQYTPQQMNAMSWL